MWPNQFLKKGDKCYEKDGSCSWACNPADVHRWLKLYDHKPVYTTLVDKYAVKDYVAKQIGQEYIIPTLGVWDFLMELIFLLFQNSLSSNVPMITAEL